MNTKCLQAYNIIIPIGPIGQLMIFLKNTHVPGSGFLGEWMIDGSKQKCNVRTIHDTTVAMLGPKDVW